MSLRDEAARGPASSGARRRAGRGGAFARTMIVRVACAVAPALANPAPLHAQTDPSWVGRRVVQKFNNFPLRIDRRPVLRSGTEIHIYRVERADGRRLWLKGEAGGPQGWALADQVVPVEQAIAFFTDRTRLNPDDVFSHVMRATMWRDRGELDPALRDFDEAIRIDPVSAALYTNRGNALSRKGEYDKAIADYDEAVRLAPGDAIAYYNRGSARYSRREYDKAIADYSEAVRRAPGNALLCYARGLAWRAKKEYDKAIADYNEAIRLDSNGAFAHHGRALALFLARRDGVVDGEKTVLNLEGWRGELSIYAVLLGHFAARRAGQADPARTLLDDAAARCDTAAWPYPIVKYLRGELDETRLMAAAVDDDKMTEVRCSLGIDSLQKGRKETALVHLRWVEEYGNPNLAEYAIALAELERLGEKRTLAGSP